MYLEKTSLNENHLTENLGLPQKEVMIILKKIDRKVVRLDFVSIMIALIVIVFVARSLIGLAFWLLSSLILIVIIVCYLRSIKVIKPDESVFGAINRHLRKL